MKLTRLIGVAGALSAPGAAVAQSFAHALDAHLTAPRVSTHRATVTRTITAN